MKNKNLKAFIISIIVVIVIILLSISIVIFNNYKKANKIIGYINDRPITQVEYDYYFYSYYNSYIANYSFLFSYMGIDDNSDIMLQKYDDDRTYAQYFDDCAYDQIVKINALYEDGQEKGFEYDYDKEYEDFYNQINEACLNAHTSVDKYFKKFYGKYATSKNIEPLLKYGFYSAAYYDYLCESMNTYELDPAAFDYTANLKKNYEIKKQ